MVDEFIETIAKAIGGHYHLVKSPHHTAIFCNKCSVSILYKSIYSSGIVLNYLHENHYMHHYDIETLEDISIYSEEDLKMIIDKIDEHTRLHIINYGPPEQWKI